MRWWEVQRFESGIPRETEWDRAMRVLQPFLVVAFAFAMIVTLRQRVSEGEAFQVVLIVVSASLLLTVTVSDSVIGSRSRLIIAILAAICAGVIMGIGGQGWPGTFSYMVALHASIRFQPRIAAAVITLNVAVAIVVQLFWAPVDITPWWASLLVFVGVIPGMARYTRRQTLAAADEVVRQTKRAAESEARSRALGERAAIARDIHDVLAHSLSGVSMQLSLADALFDSDRTDEGRIAVRTARQLVVTGLDEARAAVQTLRGDTIDPVSAISRIVSGPTETFAVIGTAGPMPGRWAHTLVRIAQESVTNARRHAPGAPLHVALTFAPFAIDLTARSGARPREAAERTTASSGLGLVGMRERAESIGATLDAGPLPADDHGYPGGWSVRLRIPCANHEEQR
ncbi:sensor histidine kinase [Gordonia sp. DT218]